MKKKLIIIISILLAISLVTAIYLHNRKSNNFGGMTVPLDTTSDIVWNKPTTDAGWAEDIKLENFDLKSSDVLQEMIDSHIAKLQKVQTVSKRLIECPECIKYDFKTYHSDWTIQDIDNAYQNQLTEYNRDIKKLQQSIERMQKELELRAKGFVVPDKQDRRGTLTKASDLQKVPPEYIRKIND